MGFLSPKAQVAAKRTQRKRKLTPAGKAGDKAQQKLDPASLPTATPYDSKPFNEKVALIFESIAQFMHQRGEDAFRIGAYERAAATVKKQPTSLEVLSEKELQKLPSIGKSTAAKIREIAETGTCRKFAELFASSPPATVVELEKLPGIGPVNALRLWEEHGLDSLAALGEAIAKGVITDQKLVDGFEFVSKELERVPLGMILPFVREFVNMIMKKHKDIVYRVSVAGSTRRGRETVRDVDILICANEGDVATIQSTIVTEFSQHGAEAAGENKCRLLYVQDMLKVQIDVLFTPPNTWGSKLMYFTGSKEFNIAVRRRAKAMGMTLNEYGLSRIGEEDHRFASHTEGDIFEHLNIRYIPPWLREQIAANLIDVETQTKAFRQRETQVMPYSIDRALVPVTTTPSSQQALYEVLGGSLHNHCIFNTSDGKQWDDGRVTITDLVREGIARGMSYVGISSHSKGLPIARGLSEDAIKEQIAHIKENDWALPVYAGSEMEVKVDGSFDWSEEILDQLDFVIAALHAQPGKNVTERIIAAMQHPKVHAIAHPSGRVFAERPIAEADWSKIFDVAVKTNTALELNLQPSRADLPEELLSKAIAAGVKILISCDVHRLVDFNNVALGPLMFNRAGGTIDDVARFA